MFFKKATKIPASAGMTVVGVVKKVWSFILFIGRKVYHFGLALIGSLVYQNPSKDLIVVGVTGTKGKSTTLEMLDAILEEAKMKTALMSSIRLKASEKSEDNLTGNTMPGRLQIQKFLKEAKKNGCRVALIEVTSEGARFFRHRFIKWGVAVFLNLAPEHIESHGSFDKYRSAKMSFFRYAAQRGAKLFVNEEDPSQSYFASQGERGQVEMFNKFKGKLGVVGEFNKFNAGAACAVAQFLGVSEEVIDRALEKFSGAPGRLEFVQKEPFTVVVDYAHTPDSLSATYETLKPGAKKMICVLGAAGGGRDKWKRAEFGTLADRWCDEVILTNEDPFDEDPKKIMNEIGVKCEKAEKILDRKEAIAAAIKKAHKGDLVIITGKGSEKFIRGSKGSKEAWSDVGVVREILGEK